jgi:hypothetical protein
MDPTSFVGTLGILTHLEGLALVLGIGALLWYSTFRSQRKANAEVNRQMQALYEKVLDQYKNDLGSLSGQHLQAAREMRQMYEANSQLVERVVALGERYEGRANALERLVQVNIQAMQQCTDTVEKCKGKS